MSKTPVETMAEVRQLHDDNDEEYASERVWSALSLAIGTIDKMRPYLMGWAKQSCVCGPAYRCLRCDAEQLLKEID